MPRAGLLAAMLACAWISSPFAFALAEPEPANPAPAPKAADGMPPVFSDLQFDEAVAQTKGTDKILIVKFTAVWCGPCKRMDKTTWRDDGVVKWIKDNGLAIQVDVDREAKIARANDISAMPTMVAFKNGTEFDRIVGFRPAAAMLGWLEGVKRGEKGEAIVAHATAPRAGSKPPPDGVGMQERLQQAEKLATYKNKRDEATKEFLWLWDHMLEYDPAMSGVRVSFMATSMQGLASEHPPAREAFAAVRDNVEARLKSDNKTWNDLTDWIVLNKVVADEDRTLAWFDRIKGDADSEETIVREAYLIEPLLTARNRWADLPRLSPDLLGKVAEAHEFMQTLMDTQKSLGRGDDKELQDSARDMFYDKVANLYAGLLAAGREDDAKMVAAAGIKLEDTPQMRIALVQKAVDAAQPRAAQLDLLDQAAQKGESADGLKQQVQAGLKPAN